MLRGVSETITRWATSLASYGRSAMDTFTKVIQSFGETLKSHTHFPKGNLSNWKVSVKNNDTVSEIFDQIHPYPINSISWKSNELTIKGEKYKLTIEAQVQMPKSRDGSLWNKEDQEVTSFKWIDDKRIILFTDNVSFQCNVEKKGD